MVHGANKDSKVDAIYIKKYNENVYCKYWLPNCAFGRGFR